MTEVATENEPDVRVRSEGTLFLFEPLTCAGTDWIEENVSGESTWFGPSLVVEHRFAQDLALGMVADGLRVI